MVVIGDEVSNTEGICGRNELDGERRLAACTRVRAPRCRRRRQRGRGRDAGACSLVLRLLGLLAEALLGADEEAAGDGVP